MKQQSLAKRIVSAIKEIPQDLWVLLEDESRLIPSLDAYMYLLSQIGDAEAILLDCHFDNGTAEARYRVRIGTLTIDTFAVARASEVDEQSNLDPASLACIRAIRQGIRRILGPYFRAVQPDARRALLATAHILEKQAMLTREHRNEILSREMGKPIRSLKDLDLPELAQAVSILSVYAQPSEPSSQYEEVAHDPRY